MNSDQLFNLVCLFVFVLGAIGLFGGALKVIEACVTQIVAWFQAHRPPRSAMRDWRADNIRRATR